MALTGKRRSSRQPESPTSFTDDPPPMWFENGAPSNRVVFQSTTDSPQTPLPPPPPPPSPPSSPPTSPSAENADYQLNTSNNEEEEEAFGLSSEYRRLIKGVWSVRGASLFASILCCVNFYTLSRFSVIAFNLKGPFILQFIILSIIFGLPFILLLMITGQYLAAGYLDIWFISPIFRGVGVALLFSFIGISIYSTVPIAWLLVYLRDSFLATSDIPYKWSYCNLRFNAEKCIDAVNSSSYEYIGWSVSGYFHNTVMARQSDNNQSNHSRFNVTFNLGLVWALSFIVLSRGLHNSGKIIVILTSFGLVLYSLVSLRFIQQFGVGLKALLKPSDKPFLTDSTSWLIAARECFIVWTLFGAIMLNINSHNRSTNKIGRQVITIFGIVLSVLILSSLFYSSLMEIIEQNRLLWKASSFEKESTTNFLLDPALNARSKSFYPQNETMILSNYLLGESTQNPKSALNSMISNYQIMRMATETFPAVLALQGAKSISSFWSMSYYLSAIMINFAFHLIIWGSVLDSIISLWPQVLIRYKCLIDFIACSLVYSLSLPLASGRGIFLMYFFDITFGSLYNMALIYLIMIIALLIRRGLPVSGVKLMKLVTSSEKIASAILPMLTFHWNLLLPLLLAIMTIVFTNVTIKKQFTCTQLTRSYPYLPIWSQYICYSLQLTPLILIFVFGFMKLVISIQINRHQSIRKQLKRLFSPDLATLIDTQRTYLNPDHIDQSRNFSNGITGVHLPSVRHNDDPPPKYSPPPSYSSATAKNAARKFRSRFSNTNVTIDLNAISTLPSISEKVDAENEHSLKKTSPKL